MSNNTKLCDCNQSNMIVVCVDGLCLCQDCRNELTLSDGTVCAAWLEREDARRNNKYGKRFQPAQGGAIVESHARRERGKVWRPGK